ncbi:unnamed protein product [Mytilus edulis]|uniref:Uncharacterized protein n=1 Tax=Mytilus edulis TaxID=6550 RepID=A0A8S3U1T4_MYTED|nr:unnamed protein product [Mytilus edulis]
MDTSSSTFQIKTGRKDQAQLLVLKVPGMNNIQPSLLRTLTIPADMKSLDILACLILPNGKFMILYSNKRLLLFSNDGIFIRTVVTFTDVPCDVCFVRNNTVAVTLRSANQTVLVDVEKNAIIEKIKFSHNCHGASSDGKILVVNNESRQITASNLNYRLQTTFELYGTARISLFQDSISRISLFQDSIYCSLYYESKVSCYKDTDEFELLWTFQHQDIDRPVGITVDNNGFVYIVSRRNSKIVVVSPDGKTCQTILSEADGIKDPWAIDINRETGMMIVSSKISDDTDYSGATYQTAFVYKI